MRQGKCAARKSKREANDPPLLETFPPQLFRGPKAVRDAFDKQSQFLLQDLHHPSLHAKKYDEARDVWQARVNYTWRFYFRIVGDVYLMEEIQYHPK